VSTTEEVLDRKVAAPVYKTENTAVGIRHADHVAPSIRKSWQPLRRQAEVGIVRSRTQITEFLKGDKDITYESFHVILPSRLNQNELKISQKILVRNGLDNPTYAAR
jgi:hypothetical protein